MRPIRTFFSVLIVTLHIGCLITFFWNKPPPFQTKKRLVVHTKLPPKPVEKRVEKSVPIKPIATPIPKPQKKKQPPPKKAPPKAKPKPTPIKKKAPPPKTKPTPVKKSAPRSNPTQPTIPKNLLDQLEESIAKIDQTDHKVKTKSRLVVPTLTLKSSDKRRVSEASFQQKLIECLHLSLALPDHGEVTIEITLSSQGLVVGLNVLKAESTKNRDYLEKHLPQVVFPPLEGADAKQTQQKFVLTFYNEI